MNLSRELRAWGGRTVEIQDYKLDTSRAGFVYRGGKIYNSVSRSLREETSIARFKEGAKKWVTDTCETGKMTTKDCERDKNFA